MGIGQQLIVGQFRSSEKMVGNISEPEQGGREDGYSRNLPDSEI